VQIDFSEDQGLVFVGSAEELRDLARSLEEAASEGYSQGAFINDDGVVQAQVFREGEA
jgi:rubrerythrin